MIDFLLDALRILTTPERLIQLLSTVVTGWWGYSLLFAIVFAETGLLVGFFFPGDSLLFTVGVVAGAGGLDIVAINLVLMAAAVIGDTVGYLLGKRTGPAIFNRPDSRLFRREHLERTHRFYEKHGGKTIVYARFVPIVRTFAPFVAGVAGMDYRRFVAYNVFGGIGWVLSMTLAGYWLGGVPIIRRHFEKVVVLIVLISVLPVAIEAWKATRKR
ncbi:MAG: VTT domain-containing protein [Bryobacteraceae bacterium]